MPPLMCVCVSICVNVCYFIVCDLLGIEVSFTLSGLKWDPVLLQALPKSGFS